MLFCCASPERCDKPIFKCVLHEMTGPSGASISENNGCETAEILEERCHLLLTALCRNKRKEQIQTRILLALTAASLGEVISPKISPNNRIWFKAKRQDLQSLQGRIYHPGPRLQTWSFGMNACLVIEVFSKVLEHFHERYYRF